MMPGLLFDAFLVACGVVLGWVGHAVLTRPDPKPPPDPLDWPAVYRPQNGPLYGLPSVKPEKKP